MDAEQGTSTGKETTTSGNDVPTFSPRTHTIHRRGGWIKAGTFIMTTTTLPTLLSLPSATASLGWVAGVIVFLSASFVAIYCFWRLVQLSMYGGKRHLTFPDAMLEVSGKRSLATLVQSLQFSVQWGVGVCNLILAAEFMNAAFQDKCTTNCDVIVQWQWTLVATGAMMLLGLMPDLTEHNLLIFISGSFTVFYCVAAVVLSFLNSDPDASYAIVGSEADKVFNGFNAMGMYIFQVADTTYIEVQSFLKPDDEATGSTVRTMHKGMRLAFSLTVPLMLMVAMVGYWAFGNTVTPMLITTAMNPKWLSSIVALMAVLQLIFSAQVSMTCMV